MEGQNLSSKKLLNLSGSSMNCSASEYSERNTEETVHSCLFCSEKFSILSDYVSHVQTHMKEILNSCNFCKKTFSCPSLLKAHLKTHSRKSSTKLSKVKNLGGKNAANSLVKIKDVKSLEKKDIVESVEKKVEKKAVSPPSKTVEKEAVSQPITIYTCVFCNDKFSELSYYLSHAEVHLNEKLSFCKICGNTFSSQYYLKTHLKKHMSEQLCFSEVSKVCSKRGTSQNDASLQEAPYVCVLCNEKFSVLSYYISHAEVHLNEKLSFCKICGKTFSSQYYLKKHLKEHAGEQPCFSEVSKVCSKRGTSQNDASQQEAPYVCALCNEKFSVLSYYLSHAEVHRNEKLSFCNICGKTFSSQYYLKTHLKKHASEQPCFSEVSKVCSKLGTSKNGASLEEAPYVCVLCNEKFSMLCYLLSHVEVHLDEKRRLCEFCGKSFASQYILKTHMKTHISEQPFF